VLKHRDGDGDEMNDLSDSGTYGRRFTAARKDEQLD
jgi:hypothetical protein